MLNKIQNNRIKQIMLENREQIFDDIRPPDPQKFMEDARAAKIAAKQYTEIRRERNIRLRRVILVAASIVAVIGVTLGVSPDARAFASRIGLQIVGLFTPRTKIIEYGLVDPDLVLVNRTSMENTEYIISNYMFAKEVGVNMLQYSMSEEGPTIATEQGILGNMVIYGHAMDYYKDSDGFVGVLKIDNTMIRLTVLTESESIFLTVARSLQVIQR